MSGNARSCGDADEGNIPMHGNLCSNRKQKETKATMGVKLGSYDGTSSLETLFG